MDCFMKDLCRLFPALSFTVVFLELKWCGFKKDLKMKFM